MIDLDYEAKYCLNIIHCPECKHYFNDVLFHTGRWCLKNIKTYWSGGFYNCDSFEEKD